MAQTVFNTAAAESFIKRYTNTVVYGKTGVILESTSENSLMFCKLPINSSHIALIELSNTSDERIGSIVVALTISTSYENSSISVVGVSSSLLDAAIVLAPNFEDLQDLKHLTMGLNLAQTGEVKFTYQIISSNRAVVTSIEIPKEFIDNYKNFPVKEGYILSRPLFKEADTLNAFRKWSSTYQYAGNDPVFFGAHLYYANPNNVPAKGEDPVRNPSKWIELATAEIPDTDISKGAKTPQLFNDSSLVITNDTAAGLRKARRDVGFQYPSVNSKVYHFDGDLLDQFQENSLESLIESDPSGVAPQFVSKGMVGLPISSDPAIGFKPLKEVPAFYYGAFSLKKTLNFSSSNNLVAYHFKYADIDSMTNKELVRITFTTGEVFRLVFNYSEIDYFYDEEISYWRLDDTPVYAEKKFLSSMVVIVNDGTETTFTPVFEGYPLINDSWAHICFKITDSTITLFFRGQQVDIQRKTSELGDVEFLINSDKGAVAIDELIWDTTASLPYSRYIELTSESLPWAEHEKNDNWLIIHAKDPTKVDTNLFDTEIFSSKLSSALDTFINSDEFSTKVKEITSSL